jgi:hypothetical protein
MPEQSQRPEAVLGRIGKVSSESSAFGCEGTLLPKIFDTPFFLHDVANIECLPGLCGDMFHRSMPCRMISFFAHPVLHR